MGDDKGTGRSSLRKPAIQNLPPRTELGKKVRDIFNKPVVLDGDFETLDLRALGVIINKKNKEEKGA